MTEDHPSEEYIDWLRRQVGSAKVLIPTNAAIIADEESRVLLQRRAERDIWSCPGGLMDIGETVLESLHREVKEETGLTIEDPLLFGIYSGPDYEASYPNGDSTAPVMMVFLVRAWSGVLTLCEESRELEFFEADKIPTNTVRVHARYLEHYSEYLRGVRSLPVIH